MFFLGLAVGLVSLPAMALTQISTQVHDIDYARNDSEDNLILLNSGLVAKIPSGKSEVLYKLSDGKKSEATYRFVLDDNRYIVEAEEIESKAPKINFKALESQNASYIPTTIASLDVAKKYFREARYNPKDSQCFNRAMVWTYEWWRNHSLRSGKILIYFTRNYVRRYNFEWWFHIAPYVHVKLEDGTVGERVMDRKYTSGPIPFKKWTDIFMNKDPDCKVITKYSDYADYPYTGECYIQRTVMYTYQPADLQMLEAWNYTKDHFIMDEVRQAYKEAFDETI